MSVYFDHANHSWVCQLKRKLPEGKTLTRSRRFPTQSEAKAYESTLLANVRAEVAQSQARVNKSERRRQAALELGIDPASLAEPVPRPPRNVPTLREFLVGRWAEHALVAQKENTRRTTRTHVAYLSYYLGDKRLEAIDESAVAHLREALFRNGPLSFKINENGEPRKLKVRTFEAKSINRILGTFAAALNLAAFEGTIACAPKVRLLPSDDSQPIVPPTEDELCAILKMAEDFRAVAPYMPEAIELAAQTGMRAGEQFSRTWSCVDFEMGSTGAIRVERQSKIRLVDGQPWRPKHAKARIIPLTPRALELLRYLQTKVPCGPHDPVIPSCGGSPYVRLEAAPDKAGKGYYPDVVATALGKNATSWHDLRHVYAVRCLMGGVPIAVVSAWLGHSDINLTVKGYGRWSSESREQWKWAEALHSRDTPTSNLHNTDANLKLPNERKKTQAA